MMKRMATIFSSALVVSLVTIALSTVPVEPAWAQSAGSKHATLFDHDNVPAGDCAGVGINTAFPDGFVNVHYKTLVDDFFTGPITLP